jgi:hypothetical protein
VGLKRLLTRPWALPALLALVVAVVGLWARNQLHESTERKVGDLLRVVCDANVAALTTWTRAMEREAALIAADPPVRALAEELHAFSLEVGGDADALRASPLQDEFRRLLTRPALDRREGGGMEGGVTRPSTPRRRRACSGARTSS